MIFKKAGYGLAGLVVLVFANCLLAAEDPLKVELKSNKTEYICSEPVLLKTTLINTLNKPFISNAGGYSLYPFRSTTEGFTFYVSINNKEYVDVFMVTGRRGGRFGIQVATLQLPARLTYSFQNNLPNKFEPLQKAERIDLLIFPNEGDFKIKSVLKDRDGKLRESAPISFKVLPLSKKPDSISKSGDPNLPLRLGIAVFSAHNTGGFMGSPYPDEPLVRKDSNRLLLR